MYTSWWQKHQPEGYIISIKHLCDAQQFYSVLLGRIQNDHLQQMRVSIHQKSFRPIWIHRGLINKLRSYQIVKVLADLPDDSRESWSEQLLHVGGPWAVPVVGLQVVNPLKRRMQWRGNGLN